MKRCISKMVIVDESHTSVAFVEYYVMWIECACVISRQNNDKFIDGWNFVSSEVCQRISEELYFEINRRRVEQNLK